MESDPVELQRKFFIIFIESALSIGAQKKERGEQCVVEFYEMYLEMILDKLKAEEI